MFIAFVIVGTQQVSAAAVGLSQNFDVDKGGTPVDVPGVQDSMTLVAGQSVYIYARGRATSSTTYNMLFALYVECTSGGYIVSTRNHEGSDYYTSAGGEMSLVVRRLFTAPMGGTYTCKLRARADGGNDVSENDKLTLLSGTDKTSISMVIASVGSAAWKSENDYDDKYYANQQSSAFNPADWATDQMHVGPGLPSGQSEYALRSSRWHADKNAQSVYAVGDIELTVCNSGTESCNPLATGTSDQQKQGSVVDTRLLVQQMPSAVGGAPCAITYDPPIGYRRTTITSDAHHQKIYHTASDVSLSSSCGESRDFIVKVEVKWVSGNPIRIERSSYSTSVLMNE